MAGHLTGLEEYLHDNYSRSVFDREVGSGRQLNLHLHGHLLEEGDLAENLKYDIKFKKKDGTLTTIPKVSIKFLYPSVKAAEVSKLLKYDPRVKAMGLGPILAPRQRYHVKNKTLFPAMKERTVVIFTLLEGELLKGIIEDFSRYEITLAAKGGLPITIMRHAIYDLRDKRGRCLLKSFQDIHRDWEKSSLYVEKEGEK